MSEATGSAQQDGQEILPVAETEQVVTEQVGTETASVHEDVAEVTTGATAEQDPRADTGGTEEAAATTRSGARARTGSRSATRTRAPKQDTVLTEAVALAREAVLNPSEGEQSVGEHLGVVVHEDRLLTHLFDCRLRGYPGWTWYATLARAPRTKHVTVCESGLIAGPESLLAPDWVPWEERMQTVQEQEGGESSSGSQDERTAENPEDMTPEDMAAETAAVEGVAADGAGPEAGATAAGTGPRTEDESPEDGVSS